MVSLFYCVKSCSANTLCKYINGYIVNWVRDLWKWQHCIFNVIYYVRKVLLELHWIIVEVVIKFTHNISLWQCGFYKYLLYNSTFLWCMYLGQLFTSLNKARGKYDNKIMQCHTICVNLIIYQNNLCELDHSSMYYKYVDLHGINTWWKKHF